MGVELSSPQKTKKGVLRGFLTESPLKVFVYKRYKNAHLNLMKRF